MDDHSCMAYNALTGIPQPNEKWDIRFLHLAMQVASWSKDPSTQVGCVLVDSKRRVVGVGYNGFPRGVDDAEEHYLNRPLKYLLVQHAEANAVLQATASLEGATAYVTHKPCASCAGILIQAGIRRIVTTKPAEGIAERFKDSFEASDKMFLDTGIVVHYL